MPTNKRSAAIILITALFFLWGFALNLNPILIPHLKKACQLTDTQSAFVDSALYIAYFLLAIPAGKFMKKYSFKSGIIFGLILFAGGAFLFYPASISRVYGFFLGAIFVMGCGMAFLETAANPYIIVLGDPSTSTQRINFAQSFNGLAASIAPLVGGMFILSGKTLSAEQKSVMGPDQLNDYLNHEAAAVQIPYLIIGLVVLSVALMIYRTPLPEIADIDSSLEIEGSIFKEKNLMFGVVAQFFYVGAQACISSFFIRFSDKVASIGEKSAAFYLFIALMGFMIGRFVGTALIRFFPAAKLLTLYSILNMVLLILAVSFHGMFPVYALMGVEFFMSIMFPTIFSLGIRGLGSKTKEGSSLLIMAIVGGAVFPVIMGKVSDASSIQTAYLVPAICFIVVLLFALRNINVEKLKLSVSH
ncbi:MAG TPA: L-fucose:H+ symporter permease [Puia sp.]|jgi:FHS family L-fucose permease-like MFS transporter